jgi:serine/threonine protein kinase
MTGATTSSLDHFAAPLAEGLWREGTNIFGRFEVVSLLGVGGCGSTYLCRDLKKRGEDCVLKELLPQHYNNKTLVARLSREYRSPGSRNSNPPNH